MKILELPFRERPVLELLNLVADRHEPDRDYAGYGFARVPRVYLVDAHEVIALDDALVLALHSADDAAPMTDDIELLFDDVHVTVLASDFLAKWLPMLPTAKHVVLALCNPHHATLRAPVPFYLATDDVESWREDGRIELSTNGVWARVSP
jgi:hypothetical protein